MGLEVQRIPFLAMLPAAALSAGCTGDKPATVPPTPQPPPATGPIQLTDVSDEVGIDFVHNDGSSGIRYIVEPMCAGLAT